jgi:hypothetical protein
LYHVLRLQSIADVGEHDKPAEEVHGALEDI